ncbi:MULTISPECIES: thaumatin family protein [Saccharopolyspora]|uniref:Thaumatin family protein n=1 Tax=Saccharopolyspora gregorii TaxID=33914 RepID=A0ABP6RZ46_9PSEU|nr:MULTISPECIES: thaumatin family protein [Saccharopolyspora]MCA1188352.1 thaumatin family protein [Saccharopolyspora sp. 6T]MCA1192067.1 thaumatin family protein [Saccharopolyspora sp. 6V]MCA1226095.1 thaumatin family protein [Saccharopolyspora sp. 6M]MCA1280229.1 thaumatin family protein [Saccharopolyspora sp. 7B]
MRTSACLLTGLLLLTGAASATAQETPDHTVTFVNDSGEQLWIGSTTNPDGSEQLTGLPVLADGESATITVPESGEAGHWRGKFFARQGCSGEPGADFHCAIGDCGPEADTCTTGEEPAGLAEFNFDPADPDAPWYNVSYVNAVSLPITIEPDDADPPPDSNQCEQVGCAEPLLPYCPPENLTGGEDGQPQLCTNPSRDEKTPYSDALNEHCPRAYGWSKQDQEPGNDVMRNCPSCGGLTVTFHRPS